MAIILKSRCPHCQSTVKLDESLLGKRVRCRTCKQAFVVDLVETASGSPSLEQAQSVDQTVAQAGGETAEATPARSRNPKDQVAPAGRLGHFELNELLGQGAFGRVYKAYDPRLDRYVALKVPVFGPQDQHKIQRFVAEAKAAARLRHPNIVPTYESGQVDNQYFIAAQYIAGRPLARHIKEFPPDTRQAAEWVRQLADALAYAHREGIVHRDIKPDNIMLDGNGVPHIMDFGLAKRVNEDSAMTTDGSILGTPAYMAPEQARGDLASVGPRSDQYSLGVVLYELLAGQKPFSGPPHSVIAQVIATEPPELGALRPGLPADLASICQVAMSKDPARRYPGCDELAADIARWLGGYETLARPMNPLERLGRWCRRSPVVASLSGAIVLLLVVGLTGISLALIQARSANAAARQSALVAKQEATRASEEAARATSEAEKAEKNLRTAEQEALRANAEAAHATTEAARATSEAEKAEAHRRAALNESSQAWLGRASAVRGAAQPGHLTAFSECITKAKELGGAGIDLSAVRQEAIAAFGDPLGLEPVADQRRATLRRLPAEMRPVHRPSEGPFRLSGATKKLVLNVSAQGVDVEQRGKKSPAKATSMGTVHCLCFAEHEGLAVGGCEEGVIVWELPSLNVHTFLRGGPIYQVAVHPSGLLATVKRPQHVEVWSLASNRMLCEFHIPATVKSWRNIEFDAAGNTLLTIDQAGAIEWARDVLSTKSRTVLLGHRGGITGLRFSPDGALLTSCSKDLSVKVWDAVAGQPLLNMEGHKDLIESVAISPDGELVASGDWGGTLKLWNLRSGKDITPSEWQTNVGQIWEVAFDPAARYLCAAGSAGLAVWPYSHGSAGLRAQPVRRVACGSGYDLALHPRGQQAAVLCRDGSIVLVKISESAEPVLEKVLKPGLRIGTLNLAFDSTGEHLLFTKSAAALGSIDLSATDQPPATLAAPIGRGFELSPDGRWLACLTAEEFVAFRPASDPSAGFDLPSEGHVWHLEWSPDASRLALGMSDGRIILWNLDALRLEMEALGFSLPFIKARAMEAPVAEFR